MASFRRTQMCCANWKSALAWLLLMWICTTAKGSADIFPKEAIIEVGTDLNITCTLQNETGVELEMPTSSDIVWYKDQLQNPISSEKYQILNDMTSSIFIVNANLSDSATYYCGLVQETNGSEYQSSAVQVGYKPKPASNLHCASHNVLDYYCQWIPQPTHIINESHIFQYRSYGGRWEDCPDYRSQNECFISVVHNMGDNQRVRVISSNGLGNMATTTSTFNPDAQTIPLPPRDLILTPISSTTLRASWQLPKDWDTRFSSWLAYRLRWALEGETHNWFRERTTRSTSFEISELQPYTKYVVQVSCRYEYHENRNAWGEWSNSTEGRTGEAGLARVEGLQMSPSISQLEVSWTIASTSDSADHYIMRYNLHQKLACPSPEIMPPEHEVSTTSTRYNLTGLDPYSRYNISVIAVNGAGQSEATTGYANTLPTQPPTITNVMVEQERTSPTSIRFTWQPLTCRNVNGNFSYYYTRIYKDGDRNVAPVERKYHFNQKSSSVEFHNLEPCTTYNLSINAVSSGVPNDASLASGVTGVSFTGLSALATGDQPSLTVNWSVPSQCNVDYYKLSYQLISREACPDVPVTGAPLYELNVTSNLTTKRLSNLEYYSTYNISIMAVLGGVQSSPLVISGDTADGEPSIITNITVNAERTSPTSVGFSWQPLTCRNVNGLFHFYYASIYKDGTRNEAAAGRKYLQDGFSYSSVEFDGLQPCTMYQLQIFAVNRDASPGPLSTGNGVTGVTASDKLAITELTQYQDTGRTILTVSWRTPSSISCQPINYEVKYKLLQLDMCQNVSGESEMRIAGVVNGSTNTFAIQELLPYSEYMVFVIGNTSKGFSQIDSRVVATEYSHPTGPPINIQFAPEKNRRLVLTWEKAQCGYRNGPITGYEFTLHDVTGNVVSHGNVSASSTPEYVIDGLDPYSNYSIRMRAWNYELAGEYGSEVWETTDEERSTATRSILWGISGMILVLLLALGIFFIGKRLSRRRMSPNPPSKNPSPPKQQVISKPDTAYENPDVSAELSSASHVYCGLYQDVKSSADKMAESDDQHEYETPVKPPADKFPESDDQHEYETPI